MNRQVGMYVRTSVEAEERGATSSLRSVILRQETNLLLVESALLRAGYRISTNQQSTSPAVRSSAAEAKRAQIPSSRGRLRALPDPRTRLRGDDA